jgi:hypothetical protein
MAKKSAKSGKVKVKDVKAGSGKVKGGAAVTRRRLQ